jgi:hypothetical protein
MEEQSKEPTGTFGAYVDMLKAGQKREAENEALQEVIVYLLSYLIQIDRPIAIDELIEKGGVPEAQFIQAFPVMLEQGMVIVEDDEVRLAPEILDRL